MVGSIWDGKQHRPAETDGRWKADGCYVEGEHFEIYDEGGHNAEQAAHIAEHDPAHVLRTIQAHRKIVERYETAVIARDAAVDTPLAGATRMALRLEREHLELVASIYFPEGTGP
jgi:hypothetical protein